MNFSNIYMCISVSVIYNIIFPVCIFVGATVGM